MEAVNIGELSGGDRQLVDAALHAAWQLYHLEQVAPYRNNLEPRIGELALAVVNQLWPDLPHGVRVHVALELEKRGIIPSEGG